MKSAITALFALTVLFFVTSAQADTYTWTDDQGTTHFTDDPGKVPAMYRRQVQQPEELPPTTPETPLPGKATEPAQTPKQDVGGAAPDDKDFAELQQGLTDREAAIDAVRSKIVTIVTTLNTANLSGEEARQLLTEHKALTEQFNQMRAEYDAYVARIRKAGFQVNIQK